MSTTPVTIHACLARLLRHDTSMARICLAGGVLAMGASMLLNLGAGLGGYMLLEAAMPLPLWGAAYIILGIAEFYGSVHRMTYVPRLTLTLMGMYMWVFIAVAQVIDRPLPTRMLLILPALLEVWVLVKVVASGPRRER